MGAPWMNTTYFRIMRLTRLHSRLERRAWRLMERSKFQDSQVTFARALTIYKAFCELVWNLQHDVNTLNTALRDREESR